MKKRILAVLLLITLCFSSFSVFAADDVNPRQGEEQYDILMQIVDLIKYYGLYSGMDDDPLERALISLMQESPEALELILQHMMTTYDERSMYLPAEIAQMVEVARTGYVGIGITMIYDENIFTISEVQPGASADYAGILPDDILIAINGETVESMHSLEEVSTKIRGDENTYVDIEVIRDGRTLNFTLKRGFIGEREFSSKQLEDDIYYMRWSHFSNIYTIDKFHAAIDDMAARQCGTLILDLRGNTGGIVSMAYEIVDALMPEAKDYLLVSYREGDNERIEYVTSPGGGIDLNQIVILCDDLTASASEIIMSALCDTGEAVSVGTQTYGKATGQYELNIPGGAKIILTAMSINSIEYGTYDQRGIAPTYVVENAVTKVPAEQYLLAAMPNIYPGIYCDEAVKINATLEALHLLPPQEKPYLFSKEGLVAINNLREVRGLDPVTCFDASSRELVNSILREKGTLAITSDRQLEKALELLREYKDTPLEYTLDEDGKYVNLNAPNGPEDAEGTEKTPEPAEKEETGGVISIVV